MTYRLRWPGILAIVVLALLPLALSAFARLQGIPFTVTALLQRVLFVAALLGISLAARRWPMHAWLIVALPIVAGGAYVLTHATLSAWVLLATFYALLFRLDSGTTETAEQRSGVRWSQAFTRRTLFRWFNRAVLALIAGLLPVALVQIESHFADEEFFTLLEVIVLAGGWMLLNTLLRIVLLSLSPPAPRFPSPDARLPFLVSRFSLLASRFLRQPLIRSACQVGVLIAVIAATALAYQRSFFPTNAPPYPGINTTTPFLCGEVAAAPGTFEGAAVFKGIMERLAANPYKGLLEYGMLAVGTGETKWGSVFRESLLQEAKTARFTGAADSVKSVQGDAAVRVYYYVQVRQRFPALFSDDDQRTLHQWFAAINRRAQTVEWVDWMYALAFHKAPEGPYENQENGAGLLALLEANGLGDPALSAQNRAYLDYNLRGWTQRFRNTDDTAIYQPEWIRNALFQASYTKQAPPEQMRRSFEWLLLQMPPDMSVLRYNHPYGVAPLGVGTLGALMLNDPRYEWLAGRALANSIAKGEQLGAMTGVTRATDIIGTAPTQGSCLLYGDSGIPTERGPLAPDKLVFRDGWTDDANYLLVNLRFSGWHRYKATGTLMSLVQDGQLLGEVDNGKPIAWLPTGRSIFRDKRIPRENLNGLVVERTGISAVLNTLTTFGGQWAQDPPYYARVTQWTTGTDLDSAQIAIDNWNGWQQQRTISFYHNGPIVIEDDASGPAGAQAALLWHPTKAGALQNGRVQLRGGASPAEMLVLPVQPVHIATDSTGTLRYNADSNGKLYTVTIFLTRGWVGAQAHIEQQTLRIVKGEQQITLPLAGASSR